MFQTLSAKLGSIFRSITGQTSVTQAMIDASCQSIRRALLEADVATPVINRLLAGFQSKAIGQEIQSGAKPGDMIAKLFYDELVNTLGQGQNFQLALQNPCTIMLVGLQGAGKTTFAARLARYLQEKHARKVLLASADIYRPAAIEQLKILADSTGITFFPSDTSMRPETIVTQAQAALSEMGCDTLIIDTAGRNHVDTVMMDECKSLANLTRPQEILFVIDSMTGQDAANIAKSFHDQLPLTGSVLTKTDSDTRGGAALSVQQITQKPIKFITTGEKIDDLDTFEPERIASQILGMGDIVGLVKQLEKTADLEKNKRMLEKFKKNVAFDFEDLKDQLEQMKAMGGMESIMNKLPMLGEIPQDTMKNSIADFTGSSALFLHLISSMTTQEKRNPFLVMNVQSRKNRICKGSGRSQKDLKQLLKHFQRMQKMTQSLKGKKMQSMMGKFQDMMRGQS